MCFVWFCVCVLFLFCFVCLGVGLAVFFYHFFIIIFSIQTCFNKALKTVYMRTCKPGLGGRVFSSCKRFQASQLTWPRQFASRRACAADISTLSPVPFCEILNPGQVFPNCSQVLGTNCLHINNTLI